MKKIRFILLVIAALTLTPVAKAGWCGVGGYCGAGWGGSYSVGGCGAGAWLGGIGVGLYGGRGGWGLSLGVGLPGLWAGIGLGGCAPAYYSSACVSQTGSAPEPPAPFEPAPPPMSAAQMAGHNTRNWSPPSPQYTGPTYFWTAPPGDK